MSYKAACLIDYPHFKWIYKMIAVDLNKQQALDADLKVIWQINFTTNLEQSGDTTRLFNIEEAK